MAYAYVKVADDILSRIRRGEWTEGQQLPPLRALEDMYPQSRMTLYKALRRLEADGYITMTRGRGTFVRSAHARQRVALLAGAQAFEQGTVPFAFHVFRHAHAAFARLGIDSQLYVDDTLAVSSLPSGLEDELVRGRLAGLVTIDSVFPMRHMRSAAWRTHAVPHISIGTISSPYRLYVNRDAFIEKGVAHARECGARRVALLERDEHLREQGDLFRRTCRDHGVIAMPFLASMPRTSLSYEAYGFDLMQRVWDVAVDQRPDAILVPDDVIAKGVAQAALALGIDVPSDLSLIILCNRGAGVFYPCDVTRFELDVESVVMRAARMLVDLLNGVELVPQELLIAPELVETGETQAVPQRV